MLNTKKKNETKSWTNNDSTYQKINVMIYLGYYRIRRLFLWNFKYVQNGPYKFRIERRQKTGLLKTVLRTKDIWRKFQKNQWNVCFC